MSVEIHENKEKGVMNTTEEAETIEEGIIL